jgi:hypothetical protein
MVETLSAEEKRVVTRERLRLLAIGHYIYGAMGALMLPFAVPFVFMMMAFSFIPEEEWNKPSRPTESSEQASPLASPTPSPTPVQGPSPKLIFGVIFGIIGLILAIALTLSALTAYAGWCIQKRKHKLFIYIMAALNCIFFPYGTLLGVSTFLVVNSAEAAEEFQIAG